MATMSVTTATRYTFAIGSKNPAKISAVQKAVAKLFANPPATSDLKNIAAILPVETMTTEAKSAPATTQPASTVDANDTCHKFIGVDVSSGVAAQPLDISVTTKGAIQRAKATLAAVPDADFAIGIESGLENMAGYWMYCGVIAAIRRSDGKLGLGTSSRFQIADHIVARLGKQELAEIVDELSGLSNVRSGLGMTGLLTNGVLPRGDAYVEGVILALCPFVSAPQYWDDPNKSSTNDSESGKD